MTGRSSICLLSYSSCFIHYMNTNLSIYSSMCLVYAYALSLSIYIYVYIQYIAFVSSSPWLQCQNAARHQDVNDQTTWLTFPAEAAQKTPAPPQMRRRRRGGKQEEEEEVERRGRRKFPTTLGRARRRTWPSAQVKQQDVWKCLKMSLLGSQSVWVWQRPCFLWSFFLVYLGFSLTCSLLISSCSAFILPSWCFSFLAGDFHLITAVGLIAKTDWVFRYSISVWPIRKLHAYLLFFYTFSVLAFPAPSPLYLIMIQNEV